MDNSYIKLSRKITEWEWYGDINTCRLFIHMLLKANWKDGEFKGKYIPRGSFASSFGKLAEETQLTVDEVRTAVKHLILTKEITKHGYSKFTVFTVKNYDVYQILPSNLPNKSQPITEQLPTIEEKKEGKKRKEDSNESKKRFIPPSVNMVQAYCEERHNGIDARKFIDFYESKGWMIGKNKMKDWKAAVRTWEKSRRNETDGNQKTSNKFNQFAQNDYDFDELEKSLLSN